MCCSDVPIGQRPLIRPWIIYIHTHTHTNTDSHNNWCYVWWWWFFNCHYWMYSKLSQSHCHVPATEARLTNLGSAIITCNWYDIMTWINRCGSWECHNSRGKYILCSSAPGTVHETHTHTHDMTYNTWVDAIDSLFRHINISHIVLITVYIICIALHWHRKLLNDKLLNLTCLSFFGQFGTINVSIAFACEQSRRNWRKEIIWKCDEKRHVQTDYFNLNEELNYFIELINFFLLFASNQP